MANFPASDLLLDLAGKAAYERGRKYFEQGRVRVLKQGATAAEAEVRGTERYRVGLAWAGGELGFDCDCPVGTDGDCCKHVVAVGLALVAASAEPVSVPGGRAFSDNLANFLRGQSVEWLADTLLGLAHEYPEVARRMELRRQLAGETDVAALKKSVSALLGRPRFLDYRQSLEYARRLDDLTDFLRQLHSAGQTQVVMVLCEYALERLFRVYGNSDDSAGAIGDRMHEIANIYCQACIATKADATLPKRLFKLMLVDDWGMIRLAAFSDALGSSGMAVWVKLLENAYAALPRSVQENDRYGEAGRIVWLMKEVAVQRGDVDLLIRLNSRELRYAHDYARLVELCGQFGRQREAVQWAERGHKAFPRDAHLRSLLAAMYLADGLEAEALELLWGNFCDHAGAQNYLALKQAAGKEWPAWRARALEALRDAEQRRFRQQTGYVRSKAPDCTARIHCLLADDAMEEARAALTEGQCQMPTRLALARRIAQSHPIEAAAHFRAAIPPTVGLGNNGAYAEAVKLLEELRPLLAAAEFARFVAELRREFKAKRNFSKLLDAADFSR